MEISAIQIVAANLWDVDISDVAAELWLPEVAYLVRADKREWQKGRRWAKRYFEQTGVDYKDNYPGEFDATETIGNFLQSKLGNRAYFNNDDKFVASEYMQSFG